MSAPRASILIVDDREQNLVALEAILGPLGHDLVRAPSGEDALRALLRRDFAAILLDVRMPGMDGFETAALIKERERTRHIPILFLTAVGRDAEQASKGYSAGAVDYILKPIDPEILRSKVSVFVDLWQKNVQLREQAELLRRQELAEIERVGEERYRVLAEAMPQLVWRADNDGNAIYYNERWFAYTGIDPARSGPADWHRIVHPDDLPETLSRFQHAAHTGSVFEMEYRFRRADGVYRWHLGRAVPTREPDGSVFWVGTATDIDDQKRAQEAQRFLVEAGELLGSSLDYRRTLAEVARAAVPGIADWCAVHVVEEDGSLTQVAVAHADPRKVTFAEELESRYPPGPDATTGAARVVRTGESELVPEIPDDLLAESTVDELHLELIRELGLRSFLCVPLAARDGVAGAISLVQAESGRIYGPDDLALAEELARRAATAIENSRLYRAAEQRARAAQVLERVGDAVVLVDADGVIRFWNPAAEAIIGRTAEQAVGSRLADVIPGWAELEGRIPVVGAPGPAAGRTVTAPVEIDGRERWLAASGVGFAEGVVYAFRDLTEERALETMRSDFVATVSHELRTPLAAIHGSALTILRPDLDLDDALRDRLLGVISEESARLAEIVDDLLLASHLDSGRLKLNIQGCDPRGLAEAVVEAAETHIPDNVSLVLEAPRELPPVAADPGQLRQVLDNLVENAIKYSPGGGDIALRLAADGGTMRFEVADGGLGIPPSEHRRVFEKFYRLDPNMARGIGGTGLGLYICRELVHMMDGRIWVDSTPGEGSTFVVELPLATAPRRPTLRERAKAAASA